MILKNQRMKPHTMQDFWQQMRDEKNFFSQLEPMLEQYKYKKEVEEVDPDTQNKFNLYVQVADESV